jgi:hypothetical protein
MKLINVTILFFIIVFLLIYFISFYYLNNNLIKYRVSKEILPEEELDYNKIKNKYVIKECGQMCKSELCTDYENQLIKYDLCKDCQKQNKCYDPYKGICDTCNEKISCEAAFGCNKGKPKNPMDTFCKKCWKTI